MQPLQGLLCFLGRHDRSGRSVLHVRGTFVATCRGCGKPMIRDAEGWRVQTAEEIEAMKP